MRTIEPCGVTAFKHPVAWQGQCGVSCTRACSNGQSSSGLTKLCGPRLWRFDHPDRSAMIPDFRNAACREPAVSCDILAYAYPISQWLGSATWSARRVGNS